MTPQEIVADAEHKMRSAIDAMTHDFGTYRTGRATPAVLERVHVEYYGTETPLNQIANISIPEPRQLLIQPYEKNMVPTIERAILKSDLGINPVTDGSGIRLTFPAMTEERRREMVKQVNHRTEEACVAIRNVRKHANDHLKAAEKAKTITEDELKRYETEIQKLTDKFVAQAHELGKKKDQELMEV
jgi:ribosome recycling factor